VLDAPLHAPAARSRAPLGAGGVRRRSALTIAVVALVLAFGSRSLLFGHLPLVGQYLSLPSPWTLLGHYLGGGTDTGLQRPGPTTPAYALLGLAGVVLLGSMGLVLKLLLAGSVVVGAIGVARLIAPFGRREARIAGAVAYLFLPLAWNDLGRGDVQGIVAYAAMPWILARLVRATGPEPSAAPSAVPRAGAGLLSEGLGLGVVLAVAGSFVPLLVLLALTTSLALAIATAMFDRVAAGLRSLAVGLLASVVALVLGFPWSLTFLQSGARWSVLTGARPAARGVPDLAALSRLALGPVGGGPLGWGLLVAAGFVLLVGRGARFSWGARLSVVALGATALAWAAGEGWLGAGGGAVRVLAAPTAVCIAALVGLGVATIGQDLRRSGFGWRHALAVLFGAAFAVGVLPVVGSSPGGRWGLAETGYDTVLSWVGAPGSPARAGRVLWLGDPRAVPLPGWQIEPGLAGAVSRGGLPDATRLWPSSDPGAARAILADVVSAESGLTIRLGHLLAPAGVRYVIVPSAEAPVLPGVQAARLAPAPQVLLDGLSAQSDLHELPSEGGTVVFENDAWSPRSSRASAVARSGGTPAPLRSAGVAAALLAWAAIALSYARRRRRAARGRRREIHRLRRGAHRTEGSAGAAVVPGPCDPGAPGRGGVADPPGGAPADALAGSAGADRDPAGAST